MPISKKIRNLKEPLDIDFQLMASEMDTSVNHIRFISKSILTDALEIECFEKFISDIEKENGIEITAFNDNTILYEYLDEAIVIHTILADKYILFDYYITKKIENKINSFIEK